MGGINMNVTYNRGHEFPIDISFYENSNSLISLKLAKELYTKLGKALKEAENDEN